jgi:hypothetical protein
MVAWVFLSLALAPLAPEAAPTLTLVWHDSTQQFPEAGLARLADEVEALFRRNGLSVTFHVAGKNENLRLIPEPRVNAIVLSGDNRRFGVPPNTMAAAHGAKGGKYSIFVFYPGVRRTLGHRDGQTSPRHLAELTLALARIVAHEVVHVLAPERGHAESGLMSGRLTRVELLADTIVLDGPSLARAMAVMKEWSCRTGPPGPPRPALLSDAASELPCRGSGPLPVGF